MEHGVKYVQGFTALGTCFARTRTQLFHNHVPADKARGRRYPHNHVPFDLFTWREACSQASLLFGEYRRDNRVIRVDRLINKSASISWKVKLEQARANFRRRIYFLRSATERRSGNGCEKRVWSPNTEIEREIERERKKVRRRPSLEIQSRRVVARGYTIYTIGEDVLTKISRGIPLLPNFRSRNFLDDGMRRHASIDPEIRPRISITWKRVLYNIWMQIRTTINRFRVIDQRKKLSRSN